MLHHGGRLAQAAQQFAIPASEWLDLSTGINPNGWPVPLLEPDCWQRLPDPDDGLMTAAAEFYQTGSLLAVAGSQAAIQALPQLRPACRVGIPIEGYAEHDHNWQQAGHRVERLTSAVIEHRLDQLDVLVLINPNNPTGERFSIDLLLDWHQRLAQRGGWLVVDEAFIDCLPQQSLTRLCPRPGLIVLRSIGKFFGLAGIRAGFVAAETPLLDRLAQRLGPWTLSGPTRRVCQLALTDRNWQLATRQQLQIDQHRLQQLLISSFDAPIRGTELFQTIVTHHASDIYQAFGQQGILLRLFKQPAGYSSDQPSRQRPARLRFGLPGSESDWLRLQTALNRWRHSQTISAINTATT